MSVLRLVVFDVDGTLVDSQADILGAMAAAFGALGLPGPEREAVLGIVGLSLDHAMPRLAPDLPASAHAELVYRYKEAYAGLRARGRVNETSPLYPGTRQMLERLAREAEVLLGIATGKSRRGLDVLLEAHGLTHHFVTQQVADHHPSKPHPSMLRAALAETGVEARDAVMVGDTSYDMDMARAAGMRAVGVRWGYHADPALAAADVLIDSCADLPGALDRLWEMA
jgi:phosphoglycolate phosphatase